MAAVYDFRWTAIVTVDDPFHRRNYSKQECLLAATSKLEDKRKVTDTINRLVAEALDILPTTSSSP
ncbi:hypothetical protein [Streptomyces sp. RB17]|uniref:hypothetical protein n=1 Tax=Streptomyces sp. RB17 TaxID=2585197 RepID=UPI001296A9B6|nr:hypothetical protein [Streptomyces sp. RB17]